MSTQSHESPVVAATLTRQELVRLTRTMTPIERATFLGLETTFPQPERVSTCVYRVHSLSQTGVVHDVRTCPRSCTCPAGQKGQECWHVLFCIRLDLFGEYHTPLRALTEREAAQRYERATGSDPRYLPEPQWSLGQWREYARQEA